MGPELIQQVVAGASSALDLPSGGLFGLIPQRGQHGRCQCVGKEPAHPEPIRLDLNQAPSSSEPHPPLAMSSPFGSELCRAPAGLSPLKIFTPS